jgi:hypothetical protein
MELAYKTFKMKKLKLLILFFIFITSINAQVVPFSNIFKINALHTITIEDIGYISNDNWPKFQFKGRFNLNGSKAPIIENGFVIKEGYYGTNPDIYTATRVIQVSSGTDEFISLIDNFPQPSNYYGTIYVARAYAKNSFNQVIYSDEYVFQVYYNFCENNVCVNGGICVSYPSGPYCVCTIDWCGTCCAYPSDPQYCPGGGENDCFFYSAYSNQSIKRNFENNLIKPNLINTSLWTSSEKIKLF